MCCPVPLAISRMVVVDDAEVVVDDGSLDLRTSRMCSLFLRLINCNCE